MADDPCFTSLLARYSLKTMQGYEGCFAKRGGYLRNMPLAYAV